MSHGLLLLAFALFSSGRAEASPMPPPPLAFDAGAAVEEGETLVISLEADPGTDPGDADGNTVKALVCIDGVCVVMGARLNGKTLEVDLPLDPDLLGRTITAYVPGVGTFTGKYTL